MKKVLVVVALVMLSVLVMQWHDRKVRQEEAAVFAAQVEEATRFATEQLDLFKNTRGVTYAEALALANDRIGQLDKLVDANTKSRETLDKPAAEHVREYMQAAQAAIRWSRAIIMAKAESAVAKSTMQEALADMEAYVANPGSESGKFRADVASYSANPAIRRSEKAATDAQAAAVALGNSLSQMVALRAKHPKLVPESAYIQDAQVKDLTFRLD